MPVKINGATSGSVTLAAPDTGSDVTLTLPVSQWISYTPNTGGVTGASPSGAYVKIGRTVIFWAQLGVTPSTTFTGNIWIGLPFTANSQYALQATQYNGSTGLFYPVWCYASSNAAELFAVNAAGTYGSLEYCNSTKPSTISGTTSRFYVSGSYEATS